MKPLLIADDSDGKIELMKLMLRHAKWEGEILIAKTSEEATDLIATHDIGFGLIDFYIPSQNGPSIIQALKQKNPAARVALVSSADNKRNFDEAKEAGAEACICTTYASDEVERALMELLGNWGKVYSR